MGSVYYIYCTVNQKVYIGSTSRQYKTRLNEHKYRLKSNCHGNSHLQNAYNKYGESNFKFGLIEDNLKNEEKIEEHYIKITQCSNKNLGFNKSFNVNKPHKGTKHSEEHKAKISNTLKGRTSPMKGRKNPIAIKNLEYARKARKTKVLCVELNKIFNSFKEAANFVNSAPPGISIAVNNLNRTCKGYHWRKI